VTVCAGAAGSVFLLKKVALAIKLRSCFPKSNRLHIESFTLFVLVRYSSTSHIASSLKKELLECVIFKDLHLFLFGNLLVFKRGNFRILGLHCHLIAVQILLFLLDSVLNYNDFSHFFSLKF